MLLIGTLDFLWDGFPNREAQLCVYVDDIAIHVTGPMAEAVSEAVSRRQRWANEGKGKTIAVASSSLARKRLMTPMKRLGIQMRVKAKHLGVSFRPGAKTRQGLAGSRLVENAKCTARAARLGSRLGKDIFRTGLAPAALYGSAVATPS